jgi:predicted nucleotide-binding protein
MIERFTGSDGRRVLIDALLSQTLVRGAQDIALDLANAAELVGYEAGNLLIEQSAADNDLYLILSGSFSILVNGREVAQRSAHQHVGEMAVIDPSSRRAASAIALEESVVARITEPSFAEIANRYPELWRGIACELGDRLRQRNELVRQRNPVPRVFIGSSAESLDVANGIQAGLAHDRFIVTVWTNGVFGPSDFSIEALERAAAETDFAIQVLGPDDHVMSRSQGSLAPRDNVILELGLFIGALGRSRVFLLLPEGLDVKIPTDLLGVTPLVYPTGGPGDLSSRLGPCCTQLRSVIVNRGPR